MKKYKVNEWDLMGFKRAKNKNKKYEAMIINKKTGKTVNIPFGNSNYEQYKDSTGLNLFSHLDHNDEERRDRFYKRFKKQINKNYWSPATLSAYYLW